MSFGVTSSGPSKQRLLRGSAFSLPAGWHDMLAAVGVVVVALAAFAFVLIVLPWVISI